MNIKGLDYNTEREKLILPEYGREVQQMVDIAVNLPTKEERQRCAETIVRVMERMLPQNRNNADWNKVVLIPVSIAYRTVATTGGQTIASVVHDMSLTSTRLVKGTDGADSPVKISIIYSKFK